MRWLKAATPLKNKQTESLSRVSGKTEGCCCTLDKPCGSWGQLPPQSQQNCVVPRQDLAALKWLLSCSCVQGTTTGSLCTELGVPLAKCSCTRQKITIPITYSSFYVSNLCFPAQTGCPCGDRAIGGLKNPLGASGCVPCSHNLSLVFLLSSP